MLNPPGFGRGVHANDLLQTLLQKIFIRWSSFQSSFNSSSHRFHTRHPSGAADLIASRIPPGRIDWVVGGRVVFFVFVVFSVFPVFVGLVAFLLCC